ncbi:MAG TPA: sigma-70 family RNA polymerase sigma factor [Niastella sp.]
MGQFYSNPDNLELAYKKYYPRILANVYQILKDEEEAKDITSQSFLILYSYKDLHKAPLPIIYSLFRQIARRKAIDICRKKETIQNYKNSSDAKDLQSYETIWACEEKLAEEFERKIDLVDQLIPKLADQQKKVFLLRYRDGKSAQKISEELGITENTVKNTLLKAKGNIKRMLNEYRNPK